jgi:hypothetical protein
MPGIIIGGVICMLIISVGYWSTAIFRHSKCDLPGSDCIEVPHALAWLFWSGRHDRLRDPLGVFVQLGSIVGVILMIVAVFMPLGTPNRGVVLISAMVICPYVIPWFLNLIFQVIRKL